MHAPRIVSTLLVCLSFSTAVLARPLRSEVEVVMFAIPEGVWQAKFEGRAEDHTQLCETLHDDADRRVVERPLEMKCLLIDLETLVQRHGKEAEFAEGWESFGPANPPSPMQKTKRFIGTTVELTRMEDDEAGQTLRVALNLEHHLAAPVMQRINYANAAVGAERDKLSVEYPLFEKIAWKGELFVAREWRLVASLLRPRRDGADSAPAMRFVIFIKRL